MRLYFPAANGLHPVPEHCQENPQITTEREAERCGFCGSCLRTGLNLAACLSAERIRYGLISLETTSSSHLHTQCLAFFFFKLSLCFSFLFFTLSFFSFTGGLTWLMQTVKLKLPVSDLETTSKGKRGLGVINCQIDAKLKVGCNTSIHVLSVLTHSVTLDWNLWDVFSLCSSNLVSLIRHWFTISAIQQLGRRSGRLIVSGTTHTSTVFVKTFGFYTFFFWFLCVFLPLWSLPLSLQPLVLPSFSLFCIPPTPRIKGL